MKTKNELHEILDYEKKLYYSNSLIENIKDSFVCKEEKQIYKYLKFLRYEEYYLNQSGKLNSIIRLYYTRKKNIFGNKLNILIFPNMCKKGLRIYHKNIIINGFVGENCKFHGNNCVGNNTMGGHSKREVPNIGNNCEFGFGAVVIGDIKVANNSKIAANAVVTKNIEKENHIWGGLPAKLIK